MKRLLNRLAVILALAVGISTAHAQEEVQIRDYKTEKLAIRLTCKSECTAQTWQLPKAVGQGAADQTWKGGMVANGVDESGECGYEHIVFTPMDPKNVIQLTSCKTEGAPEGTVGKLIQTRKDGKIEESWLFKP